MFLHWISMFILGLGKSDIASWYVLPQTKPYWNRDSNSLVCQNDKQKEKQLDDCNILRKDLEKINDDFMKVHDDFNYVLRDAIPNQKMLQEARSNKPTTNKK